MLGEAISKNPGYLKLRKLRASGTIAKTVSSFSIGIPFKHMASNIFYTQDTKNNHKEEKINAFHQILKAYRCIKILDNVGGHFICMDRFQG